MFGIMGGGSCKSLLLSQFFFVFWYFLVVIGGCLLIEPRTGKRHINRKGKRVLETTGSLVLVLLLLGSTLLQGEQLFGAERLVVDHGRGFNQILEVSARQEVAEVNELAVVLVLDYSFATKFE